MKGKFEGKPFSEALKNSIKAKCEECSELLEGQAENQPHFVVHEVRKKFKQIRALLRLVRNGISFYKRENQFFRDEARRISEVRDWEATLEILDFIYAQHQNQLYKNVFQKFREAVEDLRESAAGNDLTKKLGKIQHNLSQKTDEIDTWLVDISDFSDLTANLAKTYNRGRAVLAKLSEEPTTDDFHEWRKRIKYLRYQIEFLMPIWPSFLTTWEEQLHEMSDLVGMDRDLYHLHQTIAAHPDQFPNEENKQLLLALVKQYRQEFQQQALLLGKKLYYLDRENFTGLLGTAWKVYQKQQGKIVQIPIRSD